jgi:hypothetical protein
LITFKRLHFFFSSDDHYQAWFVIHHHVSLCSWLKVNTDGNKMLQVFKWRLIRLLKNQWVCFCLSLSSSRHVYTNRRFFHALYSFLDWAHVDFLDSLEVLFTLKGQREWQDTHSEREREREREKEDSSWWRQWSSP